MSNQGTTSQSENLKADANRRWLLEDPRDSPFSFTSMRYQANKTSTNATATSDAGTATIHAGAESVMRHSSTKVETGMSVRSMMSSEKPKKANPKPDDNRVADRHHYGQDFQHIGAQLAQSEDSRKNKMDH